MKKKHVMVVDDKEENRYLLHSMLQGYGYEAVTAVNGAEALEMARQNPPDLIISDILMPVMDGFALCREWKKDEHLKFIPFIFYTATYTDERDRRFALGLGAERFVVKPEEPEVFVSIIREILQQAENLSVAQTTPATSEQSPLPVKAAEKEDSVYLKQYNEVLIRKLEAKMEQLEQANSQLEKEIAARKQSEEKTLEFNEELERLVAERTSELSNSQMALLNLVDDLNESAKKIDSVNRSLEAINRELATFTYSASHDLRAPLRSIDGFSNILLEDYSDKLDDQGKNYLERIRRATQHMGQLIDDMLNLSRVTQSEINLQDVNLSIMVRNIIDANHPRSATEDIAVGIQDGVIIRADHRLMNIAMTNILDNAFKFTGKTEHPRIQFGADVINGETVIFVRDNGVGFDIASTVKLFGAFQRFHRTDEFPGTGIGLATVQRIINRHEGRIWAQSEPGKGATFYFTLPP